MPIYDRPVRILLRDMLAELSPSIGRPFSKEDAIAWFAQNYPKIKEGTIGQHLVRFSTNAPSRLHHGVRNDEDLLFQIDGSRFRLYDSTSDPLPIHAKSDIDSLQEESISQSAIAPSPSEFAYESDLRDFLAKNLRLIEPGLQLYRDEEGVTGIEFPVGGRFIDILAIDAAKNFVIVELKVSRGYDRVIGQILRYMAWIEKHHADVGQSVRGIIAAREISDDLVLACSYLPNVSLFEYELSVSLKAVPSPAISRL